MSFCWALNKQQRSQQRQIDIKQSTETVLAPKPERSVGPHFAHQDPEMSQFVFYVIFALMLPESSNLETGAQ